MPNQSIGSKKMARKSNAQKSEFYAKHLKAWKESGITQRNYCNSSKVAYSTFDYWRKKLLGKMLPAVRKEKSKFLPVLSPLPPIEFKYPSLALDNQKITILIGNGIQMSFPGAMDPNSLAQYIKSIRSIL